MPDTAVIVAVGSTNPVKLGAAREVFARALPGAVVRGVDVASGVPAQPVGDALTIQGAEGRAYAALAALGAEYGVGIEGGVVEEGNEMRTCAWAVVVSRDGRAGRGGSLAMPLPPAIARMVRAGTELGHAMDALTGEQDTKRGAGAVGVLTRGLVDRQRAYETLVAYALAPFLRSEYWPPAERAVPNDASFPDVP